MNDDDWQIYRCIELESIKEECWTELDKELKVDKEPFPLIVIAFDIGLVIFALLFLYLGMSNPMLLYNFFEAPILKPILLVGPPGIYGIYKKYSQNRAMKNKISELEIKHNYI